MSRIVSIWLKRWPITRLLRAQTGTTCATPVDAQAPLVLSTDASGGPKIAATNAAAEHAGLAVGDRLATARARVDRLQVRPADPPADDAALRRLALWCTRYTPRVAMWGEAEGADGLFLDVTGATHLFGSEEALLGDIQDRLRRFHIPARLALAGTGGAGWALVRFDRRRRPVLAPGQEADALRMLPIEALRLDEPVRLRLRRLGFKRIEDLMRQPRAPFTTRFRTQLMNRLDQALGHVPEPFAPVIPWPVYAAKRQLLEPIVTQDAVVAVTIRLMKDLAPHLERDGMGARTLNLVLSRVDGEIASLDIDLAAPTRNARHVGRLAQLKLESRTDIDAGHGFETLQLHARAVEPVVGRQLNLARSAADERNDRLDTFIDVLRQRFGQGSVRRLWARQSHVPERSVAALPFDGGEPVWPPERDRITRPILLLAPAEEAVIVADDHELQRFRWRGTLHHVAHAQGPERIAPEWWREGTNPTRDYYMVESRIGHRFWMYREGPADSARWFVHGLFG